MSSLSTGSMISYLRYKRPKRFLSLLDLGRALSRVSALPLIEQADLVAMIVVVGPEHRQSDNNPFWDYLQARDVKAASVYAIFAIVRSAWKGCQNRRRKK